VLVAPPYTALEAVAQVIAGTDIRLSAQHFHWEPKGAFTGEVSAAMLREAGCTHVIIGHSERRQLFGETNETVHKRLVAALAAALTPIVCVGETLEEREADATVRVVERQVTVGLAGISATDLARCVVAYEPVWAIGSGRTPSLADITSVHAHLRACLVQRFGADGEGVRLLYGGSVKPVNAGDILALAEVDGALVGGASLIAEDFWAIAATSV
jgi:triosephosphate isomerase